MPGRVAPYLVATIGVHGSASTWVFNVVRELLIDAFGEPRVLSLYADELALLPDEPTRAGRHLLIKSHHGSEPLDAWLAAQQARIVLSVRDPRDAAISMAQRFNAPFNHTVRWIANDCNRLLRLAPQGHPLLRYEDRFFEDPAEAEDNAPFVLVEYLDGHSEYDDDQYQNKQVRRYHIKSPLLS